MKTDKKQAMTIHSAYTDIYIYDFCQPFPSPKSEHNPFSCAHNLLSSHTFQRKYLFPFAQLKPQRVLLSINNQNFPKKKNNN